jgi:hypothetical protein
MTDDAEVDVKAMDDTAVVWFDIGSVLIANLRMSLGLNTSLEGRDAAHSFQ